MASLTSSDVKALMQEPSGQVRAMLASKIAIDYRTRQFNEKEETVAAEIFRILIKDTETKVRQLLAEQLAYSAHAPHDIIMALAGDIMEVSSPVLEFSTVLTEDDLLALIASTNEVIKLSAIARRTTLSESVSGKLLESSNPVVMNTLFANKGAAINDTQLENVWEVVMTNGSLLETLVHRGGLPLTIAEKLFNSATEKLRDLLAKQYKLNTPYMHKAANDSREWAVLGITPFGDNTSPFDEEQVEDFIDVLYLNNRLTHSFLMRALCSGNMSIFEAGIAKLADVPRVNARILLMEASGMGLLAIYKAAALPDGFYEAIKVLLRLSLEETEFGRTQRADFRKRILDRIYKERYDRTVENMEYVLAIIGGKTLAAANAS